MCWIELTTKYIFFAIFVFQVIVKIHRNLRWWRHKNDTKMTITRKIKIGKIWKLIFLSIEPISDLPCKFQNSPIFIFRVMVILVSFLWRHHLNFWWNFAITRKIQIWEFLYYFSHTMLFIPQKHAGSGAQPQCGVKPPAKKKLEKKCKKILPPPKWRHWMGIGECAI